MAFTPEFQEAYFAYQQDEKAFKARKAHFLDSMATVNEKMGGRVLEGLCEKEEALRQRRRDLLREFKVELDFELDDDDERSDA